MELDLRQLEVFCAVVELQSFTRAAASVHLTQASVSERVANLERAAGARLLDRLGRRVEPTSAGRWLYERARPVLAASRDLRLGLEGLVGLRRGTLVLGASTIPAAYVLPGVIAAFCARCPDASVRVLSGNSTEAAARVEAGEVELAVVGSVGPPGALSHAPLWEDELVVAVRGDHRWARRRTIRIEELRAEPFVAREPGSGTRASLERTLGAPLAAALRVRVELGSTEAVKQAVLEGLGVSVLSRRALQVEQRAGLLRLLRLKGTDTSRRFYLVSDPRRTRSPLCSTFVELLGATAA